MITFMLILATVVLAAIAAALIVGAFGLGFLLVFGDLLLFAGIVWLIVRAIIGRRR